MYNQYIEIKIAFLETVIFTPLEELKIFFLYLSVYVDPWSSESPVNANRAYTTEIKHFKSKL